MNAENAMRRPQTLYEVASWSQSISEFGANLRDWQHAIRREGVHSKAELDRRIKDAPPLLAERFFQGDIADAYLAAYAEWLADRASVPRPEWCGEKPRVAQTPWFSAPTRGLLLVTSPASFRQRNLFTSPEPVFTARPGRPRVSGAHKAEMARRRQKAYRIRIQALVKQVLGDSVSPA